MICFALICFASEITLEFLVHHATIHLNNESQLTLFKMKIGKRAESVSEMMDHLISAMNIAFTDLIPRCFLLLHYSRYVLLLN